MKRDKFQSILLVSLLFAAIFVTGCSSEDEGDGATDDGNTPTEDNNAGDSTDSTSGGTNPTTSSSFSVSLPNQIINLTEGSDASVTVQIQRSGGHNRPIDLKIEGQAQSDINDLTGQFTDTTITGTENSSSVDLSLGYNVLPIQAQERTLRVIGEDGTDRAIATLTINVQPTNLPDVYLLIGQSNMVGFSELNAKQADLGGSDAPDNRIWQLNVTGNDQENFKLESSFVDDNAIAVSGQRLSRAVDPLHNGFDTRH